MDSLLKPPPLCRGDTVAVVAPASGPPLDRLEAGIASLREAGFEVRTYRDFAEPSGYLSASDDERVGELNAAIRDDEVRAIIAARGGNGLTRIVDRVDYETLRRRPKIVAGYSDLTALHTAINRHAGLVTFHSLHVVDGIGPGARCETSSASFLGVVGSSDAQPPVDAAPEHPDAVPRFDWGRGSAEGPLVGGNLAVLTALLGTPHEPDTRGAIVLLEDIGEADYRIDRMLSQLRLAGKLDTAAGFVLGYFNEVTLSGAGDRSQLEPLFRHYLEPLGVPVMTAAPIGHATPNHTVALGARYRVDADAGRLIATEGAVSP